MRLSTAIRTPAHRESGNSEDERDRRLKGEEIAAGKGQRQEEQGDYQEGPADIVDVGAGCRPVGQAHQRDEHNGALGHVQPEDPAPTGQLHNGAAVGRTQHGAGLRRSAHHTQGECALFRGHQRSRQGHAQGNCGPAANGLDDTGSNHELETLGDGDEAGADAEDYQRCLVNPGIAVDIAETADYRHGHGVAQQVGRDDPGDAVQLGDGDLQVQHHAGQGCYDNRLVEGGNESTQAGYGQDCPSGILSIG